MTLPIPVKLTISELQCQNALQAVNVDSAISMSVEAKVIAYPLYGGENEITPSSECQILQTAGKTVESNIIINPIPQNYGLITWNGSYLTVS